MSTPGKMAIIYGLSAEAFHALADRTVTMRNVDEHYSREQLPVAIGSVIYTIDHRGDVKRYRVVDVNNNYVRALSRRTTLSIPNNSPELKADPFGTIVNIDRDTYMEYVKTRQLQRELSGLRHMLSSDAPLEDKLYSVRRLANMAQDIL